MTTEAELRNELQTLKAVVRHVADELTTWGADVVADGTFVGSHEDLAHWLIALGKRLTDAVERHPADPDRSAGTPG